MVRLFIQNGETTYVVEMTSHTQARAREPTGLRNSKTWETSSGSSCTILLLLLKEIAQEPKTDEASILLARILQVWRSIRRFVRSLVD